MSTIADALAPHAVDRDEVVRRYPGPAGLVSRILGVVPHAWGLLEVWPPALQTYNLSVPSLMDVPRADLGRGLDPETRALVAHATSRAFGCMYCSAHTAIMGTVVRGPADAPSIDTRVGGTERSAAEQAALAYATTVGEVPAAVTATHVDALRQHYDAYQVESIILIATVMGFLNRAMDTLGTPLETAVDSAASAALTATGWAAGKHAQGTDAPDRDERLRVASRWRMLREVPSAVAYERRALSGIPSRLPAQQELLQSRMGFVPSFVGRVQRGPARRLIVHWLADRLVADGAPHTMPVATKAAGAYVQSHAAGNAVLAAQMAFVANRAGATVADLTAVAAGEPPVEGSVDPVAIALAQAASGPAGPVDRGVVDEMVATHGPDGAVEMVLSLAIAAGLHRLTASLPNEGLEAPIEAFVAEHGLA